MLTKKKKERERRFKIERQMGRRPYGNRGRAWSDVATSQGTPGVTRSYRRKGKILS